MGSRPPLEIRLHRMPAATERVEALSEFGSRRFSGTSSSAPPAIENRSE